MSISPIDRSAQSATVSEFLERFRLTIEFNRCDVIRGQVDQDLAALNLIRKQAFDFIKRLTIANYCSGPVPDDTDNSKAVWIFGIELDGREIYVKLRLAESRKNEIPRGSIWSFHPAKHPMKYPLREGP